VKKVLLDQYWSEFIIRYYPSPNEQVFEDFSFYEKVLRLSEFFDRDGRPRSDLYGVLNREEEIEMFQAGS